MQPCVGLNYFFYTALSLPARRRIIFPFLHTKKVKKGKRGRRHTGYIEYDKQLGVLAIHEVKKNAKIRTRKKLRNTEQTTGVKHGKTCKPVLSAKKMQPVPSVGKHATGAKRGKNVKLMPNMRRVTSTGKHESVPSRGKRLGVVLLLKLLTKPSNFSLIVLFEHIIYCSTGDSSL